MFGIYIRTLRITKHKTQQQLADALGCDRVAVHNWEKGKNYPDFKKLPALAAQLGITFNELVSELGPERNLVPGQDVPIDTVPLTPIAPVFKERPSKVPRNKAPRDPVLDDLAALLPEDADVWRAQIRAAATKARRETAHIQQALKIPSGSVVGIPLEITSGVSNTYDQGASWSPTRTAPETEGQANQATIVKAQGSPQELDDADKPTQS